MKKSVLITLFLIGLGIIYIANFVNATVCGYDYQTGPYCEGIESSNYNSATGTYTFNVFVNVTDGGCQMKGKINEGLWYLDNVLKVTDVCSQCIADCYVGGYFYHNSSGTGCPMGLPGASPANPNVSVGPIVLSYYTGDPYMPAGYVNPFPFQGCNEEHGGPSDCPNSYRNVTYRKSFTFANPGVHSAKLVYYVSKGDCGKSGVRGFTSPVITLNTSNVPVSVCGDGVCNNGEDCMVCPVDCGSCLVCSDSSQTIMKLTQQNDSNGALWNSNADYLAAPQFTSASALAMAQEFDPQSFQYIAYPGQKIYLFSNDPNGLDVSGSITVSTDLGSYSHLFVNRSGLSYDCTTPMRLIYPVDITNLFLDGSETGPVTRTTDIVFTHYCAPPSAGANFGGHSNVSIGVGKWDVCYNDIFGVNYAGTNPHDCVSGNLNSVVWLNLTEGSNASNISSSNFNLPVCYGDLQCSTRTTCLAGEKAVVSLSNTANSLISAEGNDVYKICCRSAAKAAYWSDLDGKPINHAGLGSKVRLNVQGLNLDNINYTIMKTILWWFDKKVSQTSSSGFDEWRAGYNGTSYSTGSYYFTARTDSAMQFDSRTNVNFGTLAVGAEINLPIVLDIVSPKDRQIYFKNEVLSFNSTMSDPDDNFNFTWNLGDGTVRNGNSIARQNQNFTYAYNSVGQKVITLNTTSERGQTARKGVTILVVD